MLFLYTCMVIFQGFPGFLVKNSLLAKNFIELVTVKFCFSLVTLKKLFVANLLQYLECAAKKLCVYKVVDAVHGKRTP